MQHDVTAVLTV